MIHLGYIAINSIYPSKFIITGLFWESGTEARNTRSFLVPSVVSRVGMFPVPIERKRVEPPETETMPFQDLIIGREKTQIASKLFGFRTTSGDVCKVYCVLCCGQHRLYIVYL